MDQLGALRADVRQALIELALTSVTRAASLDAPVSGGAPESRAPRGEPSAAEPYLAPAQAAWDDERRLTSLLAELREALQTIRHSARGEIRVETELELQARIITLGAGWTARETAIALRCSERMVRRLRMTAGRDAERGRPLDPELANGTPVEFGRALLEAGFTLRAAAAVSGVPRSTLWDRSRAPA
jgi:hypothetical protein